MEGLGIENCMAVISRQNDCTHLNTIHEKKKKIREIYFIIKEDPG